MTGYIGNSVQVSSTSSKKSRQNGISQSKAIWDKLEVL